MKRMIMIMLLLAGIASKSAWANDERNVTPGALKTFRQEFPQALFAHWEKMQQTDLYLVRFVDGERGMLAYISEEGELRATARLISTESAPLNVIRIINRQFSKYQVEKVEELVTENSVSYIVNMRDSKHRLLMRIFSNGTFQRIRKEKIPQ